MFLFAAAGVLLPPLACGQSSPEPPSYSWTDTITYGPPGTPPLSGGGDWNGTSSYGLGTFTQTVAGPVDVSAAISGGSGWSHAFAILDYLGNGSCSGVAYSSPFVEGTNISYNFASVAPGQYCMNVPWGYPPLQITTSSVSSATSGQPYNAVLVASGGTGTGYIWSLSSGSLPAGFTLSAAGVLSSTGSPAAPANSYSFVVQVTDSFGNSATQPLTLVVGAASLLSQTITFGPLSNEPLGTAPFPVSATASSGLAVTFASTTPLVCTVSGNTVTLLSAGMCSITASQAGNATYAAAAPVIQSFTVAPLPGALYFVSGQNQTTSVNTVFPLPLVVQLVDTNGAAAPGYWVYFSATGPVSISPTAAVTNINGQASLLVQAGAVPGPATVTASVAGGFSVTFNLTVNGQSSQTITFGTLSNVTLGVAPFPINATASSGLAVTFASTTPSVCTVSGNTVTIVAAGPCSITASQAGNANYAAATPVTQSFTVASGGPSAGNITYLVNLTVGAGSVTGNIVTDGKIGVLGQADIVGYNLVLSDHAVSTPSTFNLSCCNFFPFDGSDLSATATQLLFNFSGTDNGQVTFADPSLDFDVCFSTFGVPNSLCEVAGETLTFLGTSPFDFDRQSTGLSGTQVIGTAATGTAAQSITFGALGNVMLGVAPFTISATASSGLVVSFTSTTPAVCTVSGSTVTILAVGTCTIAASQSGNASYAPAAPVTQSFLVSSSGGSLTLVAFGGQSALPNQAFPEPVVFQLRDASSDPVPGALVSFAVTTGDASLSPTAGTTNVQGQVSVMVTAGPLYPSVVTVTATFETLTARAMLTVIGPGGATCASSLAPASQVFPAAAGTGTVGVMTDPSCPWTATSESPFLAITSGSSGTGPGTVQFSAIANTAAAARTGTLIVAGQAATINQAGTAPLLLLSPSSISIQWTQQSPLPAVIPLSIFTGANSLAYTASASSTGNWLSVSPTSGNAPATIFVPVNPSSLSPGPYQGTVTVTAPAADPSSQTFTISLTVVAAGAPALSVVTKSLNYSFSQGAQQAEQQTIPIGNSGGGTLSYLAAASTSSGGNWLSVMQDGAGATLSTPDLLTVTVNPSALAVGTYTGLITITANTTIAIPVTVTVSAVQQTISLLQTGLTFTAVVNGGTVPPQSFGIFNSGTGVMDWSVSSSITSAGNWLLVTPASGSTDASSPNIPLVTVSVNPANLAPGQYSGQIQVTSATANNTPEYVSVILNVLPAGSDPGALVLPTGLIFTQAVGGAPPGSQTIAVSNLTGSAETFATETVTTDGAGWLSVTPAAGNATPAQATTLTISVSSTGLSPGIRQGILTLFFEDGSVRTVNVLHVLAAGGATSQSTGVAHPLATSTGGCTPTKLLPLLTTLGSQFTVPAAWPNTLEAQVVDDCGNPQVSGTVVTSFSNGDPPVPLISLGNGSWTGTWQVNNSSASVIAVTVNADEPNVGISGSISLLGRLQSSANAPVVAAGGLLNAASYSLSAPLAPGSMVAIFGSNLANGTSSASSFPLPNQLSGTLVTVGGEPAPLLYAGSGQINAVIPFGLAVNTNTQVIVRQGDAYTSPVAITLAAANPAIFTTSGSGTGQGIIIRPDGNYAQPGTPAQADDELVIYAAGLGATNPQATASDAATATPLLYTAGIATLTIGGQNARVDFAGLAPGYSGLYQINAAVPAGVHGNALPVILTVGGQSSPVVTMAVQ